MKRILSYKNCLIRTESFQVTESSSWIPRYILTRQGPDGNSSGASCHRDRLDQVFCTEGEADDFALQDAVRWIDSSLIV
jgi:hypothetical protein